MYQCQLCQFKTNNNNQYQKHLVSKNHLFNIDHCFEINFKNKNNVLLESKKMTHKQFLDWCIFLDSKVFGENNYHQIIVLCNQEVKFKIIPDQVVNISLTKTEDIGISCNLVYNMNNSINSKYLIDKNNIDKNISIYGKNIISIISLLFSYLNSNFNWIHPYSPFIQGFIVVGCLFLIYLILSSLLWILLWSILGGFGWKYVVKKLK